MARRGSYRRRAPVASWTPRDRVLYKLTDQDISPAIPITAFGIGGRDPSWNQHADAFLAANRPQFEALELSPQFTPTETELSLRLRSAGMIGAVPLRSPDTRKIRGGIVVEPRFGWSGIGPVMQRTGWSARPQILEMPLVPGSAKETPSWVLAGPLLQRLEALLRELRRGFHVYEELRQTPRGQILWPEYTKQLARGTPHLLPCRYPDLGHDVLLRGFIRWGVGRVRESLAVHATEDPIARALVDMANRLLDETRDVLERPPTRGTLDRFSRLSLSSAILQNGIQALGWIVDERGLAGQTETDGLAWSLSMQELFESWVEHLVREWAHDIGGEVKTGRQLQTLIPIEWDRGGVSTMKSLIPDLVVRRGDSIWIFDAKYKSHFLEFTESRWMEVAEEIREQHRHDLHQVLAYAAVFEASDVESVLVYPIRSRDPAEGEAIQRPSARAALEIQGRRLGLRVAGVPLTPAKGFPSLASINDRGDFRT
ncbi:MAG TPA: hypothetical protein VM557_11090 [Thermoanaerobaculia bacterium]|nr:hypothetical protein [Thermoanaerobaculia bacterium]